jgi:MFS family permease
VGSSFLIVGALAAILALTREEDRGRLTARVRMAMSLGLPAGLSLGGLVADFVSDNAAFLLAAGLSFCGAVLAFTRVPGRTQRTSAPRRNASAWDDWKTLLAQPSLRFVWSYYFLVFFSIQGILLATLVIFITRRGLILPGLGGQGSAGVLMGFLMLWRAAAAIAIGRCLDRTRHRRTALLPAAVGLLLLGFILLAIAHNLWWACAGLMCLGAGTGAVTIPLLTLLGDVTSADRRGRALAIYQVFGDIGGSLGPIVGLEAGMDFGFLAIYLGLAAIFAISVPFTFWSKRYERADR